MTRSRLDAGLSVGPSPTINSGIFMPTSSNDPESTSGYVPDTEPADTAAPALAEGPGTRIGPYKLLQPIGEGGMGAVWLAEQQEPVRRQVALKVIKAGLDSAQVVARFEAERQA